MDVINSNGCNRCTADRKQTSLHIFYECENIQLLFMWLLRVTIYECEKLKTFVIYLYLHILLLFGKQGKRI